MDGPSKCLFRKSLAIMKIAIPVISKFRLFIRKMLKGHLIMKGRVKLIIII